MLVRELKQVQASLEGESLVHPDRIHCQHLEPGGIPELGLDVE